MCPVINLPNFKKTLEFLRFSVHENFSQFCVWRKILVFDELHSSFHRHLALPSITLPTVRSGEDISPTPLPSMMLLPPKPDPNPQISCVQDEGILLHKILPCYVALPDQLYVDVARHVGALVQ